MLSSKRLTTLQPLQSSIRGKLVVENLNVYFGRLHALKNISIVIPDRQVTAIIGPSGCGKTTFLRSLNRMIELIEGARVTGKVFLDGFNIYSSGVDVSDVRRRVGMVFQKPNPLPMSIYDNIAFGPRIHGIRYRKVLDKLVEEFLKAAELWDEVKDRLKDPATSLSGGQQQRLCIARALAVNPEVLLMDEPTASLDPISSMKVESLIRELKRKYTIIVVTHNLQQAMRIADYVAFLFMGELIEHGSADEFFSSPRKPKTIEYLRGAFS
ncbi:MAG: phosphate ABC transporter ATP-binding protein [Thermoprotei archaeon]|nr:MAG: phosphate ABC transporter ATP-binding protein [Thermoprotei archaeon]